MGCTYTPEKTTFKVWSPEASSVVLCRYEEGNGGSAISETPMTKGDKGVWSTEVTGDIVNTYYTYKVTVNETTKEAVDIYAKAAGVNGNRAMVVDLDSTDPEHWDKNYQRERTLLSDIVVWEVHIRDFSIDVSSGVSEQNRGKYKAFTERTTINGEGRVASCVDYLKELGVTHVQLLPMCDFASVDETNVSANSGSDYSWGYDPQNYNVPEGSYSSNPYDGNVRITEMKEMIQALHDAGIKVIMDVAYSHTSDAKDSNFNKIMPDYYYKLNDDLSYNDQSGYGNATRSDSAMFRKFMIDSVSYWAEEYNLDGFRFDLMGIHDVTTMNQIRTALDSKFGEDTIVLYGDGQTGDGRYDSNSAHRANESRLDDGIGYYNEQIKEALKGGDGFDGTIGLVQTNYFDGEYLEPNEKWPNNVFGGIMGSVGYTAGEFGVWRPFWSKSSNCCLSYVSSHDNLTLWDKLAEGLERDFSSVDDKMIRMNRMAGSVVLVSKGGVFMQAGEEFARTKNGAENGLSSSASVNKLDWNRVNTYSDIQSYYQGMIRIRKAFSGFRSILKRGIDNWEPRNTNIEWISKEEAGVTAFYETNNVPGEWDRIAVLINNAISDETVHLTDSDDWVIVADGTKAGLEKISESGSDIVVPGKSVMIAVPKDTFDENHVAKNEPPVITCDTSFRVFSNASLSFMVETSDPDKDTVTLTADGIPNGASFDVTTGEFRWDNPSVGEYTVTLTANDRKTAVTKTITITVMEEPTATPTIEPTATPTEEPTATPTIEPTATPTEEPTVTPTEEPTEEPTATPTIEPTATPTEEPTVTPTEEPTIEPTEGPTIGPTEKPTIGPTEKPTEKPTLGPTVTPTIEPTEEPTLGPTVTPTEEPTIEPTEEPTIGPTEKPTEEPTIEPTKEPTEKPTSIPTLSPTGNPSEKPTFGPTQLPTEKAEPTEEPHRMVEPPASPVIKKIKFSPSSKKVKAGKKLKLSKYLKITKNRKGYVVFKYEFTKKKYKKYASLTKKGVLKTKKKGRKKTIYVRVKALDGSKKTAKIKIKIR